MPWAFSPKHYLPPKNQNVSNLWKTFVEKLGTPVGFTSNDRSPMTVSTFRELLCSSRVSGRPLEVSFHGGHHRDMIIRSVGGSWFSARVTGPSRSELVISLRAVHTISGELGEPEPRDSTSSAIPLRAMLVQLERQQTEVIVHLPDGALAGRIFSVGQDYLRVQRSDHTEVVIPMENFLWLEACG
jgi:hypothetical protein